MEPPLVGLVLVEEVVVVEEWVVVEVIVVLVVVDEVEVVVGIDKWLHYFLHSINIFLNVEGRKRERKKE